MFTPAPLSDEGYSLTFASERPRTNYVRGGLNVQGAYDTELPFSGRAIGDLSYTVSPSVSLAQSRSRTSWDLTYSPGFRFYQHNSFLNGTDHNLALGFQYRLSPHVTLKVADSFQKMSTVLNAADDQNASNQHSGGVQGPSQSIVLPATPRITHFSDVEMTYQFGQNSMIGAKGSFSGLWYPNRASLSGLFDSTTEAGETFYTQRLSDRHYVGAVYGLQTLLTHPGHVETQTQSTVIFYTLYLPPTLAVSVFAGPEHSDTHGRTAEPLRRWSPAAGGSVGWHGAHVSFAGSYARRINDGGGLSGAVRSNRADASARWQLARTVTANVGASYSTSRVLDPLNSFGSDGHSWSGTVSVQHPVGERFAVQMGYTRLHQNYRDVAAIANAPNRNNAWVSLSYQFERPLGR
ncbi:MAG TPA: hypothetical protein VK513_01260 [Terriglobales bacterium]|jgi:hypothetical protein|nr:hypothetical protein [Terriglobales bacterium]